MEFPGDTPALPPLYKSQQRARRPSLHAHGAVIDLVPDSSGNRTHWPFAATMPFEVMEAFTKKAGLPPVRQCLRGPRYHMHFQTTR